MARSYFSNKDVCVEALFEETNNVCICSRAHLQDYQYTLWDYNSNPFDDECGVCYEEVPKEDFCEDTSDLSSQALKESSEDPEMPYNDALDDELELMKSMGLPTSFGKKLDETKNYSGFYSAYNCDSYDDYYYENEQSDDYEEYDDENEQNDLDEYDQNGECYSIKSDNEESNISNKSDNSRIKHNENNKNSSKNNGNDTNSVLKYNENNNDFESFWTLHGDSICLNSWVEKFKDYVTPEFLESFKQCGNLQKAVNSDTWSSLHYQSAMQHNTSCTDINTDSETLQASSENNIVLNNSFDNCDSGLSNMNDRFGSMSFSDEIGSRLVNDVNMKCNESTEPKEVDVNLDSYELYSESILPYTTADFEKGVEDNDFNLSSVIDLENSSFNEFDVNSDEPAHHSFEDKSVDTDITDLKDICPEIVSEKQTQNPLFICTKSNEEYEAEIKFQTWEELWFDHCQEEFNKYSKFFSENPIELSKYSGNDFSKCKYCGEINCLVCDSEYKNDNPNSKASELFNELVSDSHSKSNFFPNNILAYPVIHNYMPKDRSVSGEASISEIESNDQQQMNKAGCSDDDSPVEIPIKRFREIESENEEPEDMIKDLGFVIKPTKSLRIKKKNQRIRKSHARQFKMHLQIDDNNDNEVNNEFEETEKNSLNMENNGECENKIADETDEPMETKVEEETSSENITESAPLENTEDIDETSHETQNVDSCKNENVLEKYWHQRYRLFHRFDEGIKLDEESWFSVTPERIAKHIAKRCACGIMVDAFCGAGGNAIQFASVCYHVIAIDKDPKKIELAKHNATVYGVDNFIDFIVGDYLDLAPYLKADGVFLSPPWGGPSYANDAEYSIEKIEPDIYKIFEVSRKITENIALFVPKNTIINQLVQLSGEGKSVEIEQNFLNKKVKTITAYYGEFVRHTSAKKDESR